MSLSKYIYISKVTFINQMAHRTRFFSPLVLDGIVLLVSVLLWYAIYQQRETIQGYTFSTMATYYALNMALTRFKTRSATGVVGDDIKDGRLSIFLLKPYRYNLSNFVELFTVMFYRSVIPVSTFIALHFLFPNIFLGSKMLFHFVMMVALGLIIGHLLYSSLGNIAFWTANTWGVFNIVKRFVDILSGHLIPLDFLPGYIKNVVEFMPFKFLSYVPNSVYLGNINGFDLFKQYLLAFSWIAILLLINKFVWSKGMKRYESVGN